MSVISSPCDLSPNTKVSLWRHTGGLSGIEFAMIAPLLVLMLVSTVDIGSSIYTKMQVETASQAGAQYAAINGFNSTAIATAVTNATPLKGVSASPAPTKVCGCPSSTGIKTAICNSTCASGSTAGYYVSVTATGSYDTLLPYPTMPAKWTYSIKSTVRIQ